jgi:hypothetical protein
MRFTHFALTLCWLAALATCSRAAAQSVRLEPMFGPAVPSDTISGRSAAEQGPIVLLAGGTMLVTVDLAARNATRTPLRIPDPRCWGLAHLSDGSLWTIQNRRTLVEVHSDGTPGHVVQLDRPHLGLFAMGERLILQPAATDADAPALRAGGPDAPVGTPWSDIKTRAFPGLHPGAMMALNMVSCGVGLHGELPCWFPDEPTLFLVRTDGRTRRIELAGLSRAAPEILLTSQTPPRPIRDAYIDPSGTVWILSTGNPGPPPGSVPGGLVIARFGPRGEPIDTRQLAEPVRLILRARAGRAVILTSRGIIAELQP